MDSHLKRKGKKKKTHSTMLNSTQVCIYGKRNKKSNELPKLCNLVAWVENAGK